MAVKELVIDNIAIPFNAQRGITQSLEPIAATIQLARTINGVLRDVSAPLLRKYRSVIVCRDYEVPQLNNVWPGKVVTVDCLARLWFPTVGGVADRPIVESWAVSGGRTYYRPRLTMLVTNYTIDYDEWSAYTGWTLNLEEQ